MAITPNQLDIEASYIQDAYMAMEDEIMRMLVRQLNKPTRTPLTEDNVLRWKLEKMQQLNLLNQQVKRLAVRGHALVFAPAPTNNSKVEEV